MVASKLVIAPILSEPVDGYGVVQVAGIQVRCYFNPLRLSEAYAIGTRALVAVQPGGYVALWRLP